MWGVFNFTSAIAEVLSVVRTCCGKRALLLLLLLLLLLPFARLMVSFSFFCSDWEEAALAAASFFLKILCRRHRKSITTAGFLLHRRLAAIALGEGGCSSYQTRESDRTGGYIIPLELEPGARRMETNTTARMNAVFGLVVSVVSHRQEAPHSEMGLAGRHSSP